MKTELDFELRPYQEEGVKWLQQGIVEGVNRYLCDEPGLGKTIQVARAFVNSPSTLPRNVLIVAPASVLYLWRDTLHAEIRRAGREGEIFVQLVIGTPAQRDRARRVIPRNVPTDNIQVTLVYICTYGVLLQDFAKIRTRKWGFLIFDEAHRISNRQTKTADCVRHLNVKYGPQVWMVSGTPARRGPQDLWTNLHVLDRALFTSYWKYIKTWMVVEQGQFGREIVGMKPQHKDNFKLMVKPYILRRKKELLGTTKTRGIIPVAMTPKQKKLYNTLEAEFIVEVEREEKQKGYLIVKNALDKLLKLRQIVICPTYYDSRCDIGGALTAILEHAKDQGLYHFAIFSPFPMLFDHIKEAMFQRGFNDPIAIHGGTDPLETHELVEQAHEEQRPLLISIRSGEGFSAPSCSTGYFLGYEYTPSVNYQAEDRIHRANSPGPVQIHYMKTIDTVDEDVLNILNDKNREVSNIFGDDDMAETSMRALFERIQTRRKKRA